MGSDGEKEIDTVKGFFVLKLDELPTYKHNAYDGRQAMTRSFHEKFGAQQPGLSAGSHLTPNPPKEKMGPKPQEKRKGEGLATGSQNGNCRSSAAELNHKINS